MSQHIKVQRLLYQALITGSDEIHTPLAMERTFQLTGFTSASVGSATVNIEVSNDGENFLVLHTMTITLSTTVNSDSFYTREPWKYVQGNVTAISGTDAQVTLTMGNEGY